MNIYQKEKKAMLTIKFGLQYYLIRNYHIFFFIFIITILKITLKFIIN